MKKRIYVRCVAAALTALASLALSAPSKAADLASGWARTDQASVRLVAAPAPPGSAAGALRLGLQFKLQPHWKIYWRSPGDAGLPPEIDWSGDSNVIPGAVSWPTPIRFEQSGLETLGYKDEVVLPIAARFKDPAEGGTVKATVSFLTCSELCVPNDVALTLDLPPGGDLAKDPAAGETSALIDRFQSRVPEPGGKASGISVVSLRLTGTAPGVSQPGAPKAALTVFLRAEPPMARPDAVIEGPDGTAFGAPAAGPTEDGVQQVVLPVTAGEKMLGGLAGKPLTVTLIDRSRTEEAPRAAEFHLSVPPLAPPATATPAPATPVPATPAPAAHLSLRILALALLGGFILNFMPCVLPVLSIKLIALIGEAGRGRRRQRASFLATSAGILASFLAMAAALAAAKSAGLAIGWGIQFQQPVFLAVLAALVALFACNLLGWIEFALPWRVSNALAGEGIGGHETSLGGSFLTGAFATLLATPCSAPFLGTAVGFALAGGTAQILAVFLCLGLGLSLPYLLVAAFPGLSRIFPKPGRWMLGLRRLLALPLVATALWLVGVLASQTDWTVAGGVAAAAALAGMVLALRSRLMPGSRRVLASLAATLLFLATLAPPLLAGPTASARPMAADAGWRRFEPAAIAQGVAAGKIVFVDVTARWCLTCQVNERVALSAAAVRAKLAEPGILALRADWTRPDETIAAFLRAHGRYGIPFNIVYGPAAPDGIALSEVLTEAEVLAALEKAGGTSRDSKEIHS